MNRRRTGTRRKTPFQKIRDALNRKTGVKLSPSDVSTLVGLYPIVQHAEEADEIDRQRMEGEAAQ